ncbi:MAG: Sua5/YciO/YrdC/YwlC family protein, partial [Parasporobacterium sp.]|nr:Sua5/YciO/YrdC/YwlC family protein [Parasporobacterium sp.]
SVTAEDVREDLDGKIPVVIDGGACPVGLSSTVVDMSVTPAKILREGSVTKEMLGKYTDIA